MPTVIEKVIWKFYYWSAIFVPIGIMISHWYIFYVFSQNKCELMHYSPANEVCIKILHHKIYCLC